MKPIIVPALTRRKLQSEIELENLLMEAVEALDSIFVWPDMGGQPTIRIMDACATGFPSQPIAAMRTGIDFDEDRIGQPVCRTPGTSIEIEVSANIFGSDIGGRLHALGATKEDVIFHFLAHEIHHFTEAERMAECGIVYPNHKTHFAGAARADFPKEWKTALKAFTEMFPNPGLITERGLMQAGEIANEAAADLFGLHCMRAGNRDWEGYAKYLIELRETDFINAPYGSRRYEIADFLKETLTAGLAEDVQVIFEACWNGAKYLALANMDALTPVFGHLAPLILPPTGTCRSVCLNSNSPGAQP